MSKIEGNEPINPTIWDDRNVPYFLRDHDGLTIRQHYAGLAMQGLISSTDWNVSALHKGQIEATAEAAVQYADALITELNKLP